MNGDVTSVQTRQTMDLLAWYREYRRILPWREDPTPYHVWLSEIMLQQTRVEAVKVYYARFLDALPDIPSLAAAKEDVYLKLWEGLGYYSRVRNLHKAAIMIMNEYDGEMPATKEELLRLPGIGDYTASAIASIAFHQRYVALDGNFLRVFARMTEYGEEIKSAPARQAAMAFYKERIPSDIPGEFNQAVMDLGATVCTPNGTPHCNACPWQQACLACLHGTQMTYPVPAPHKARPVSERTVFLIHCHDRIAIDKRPARGLLAGLYEFPNADGFLTRDQAIDYVRSLGFEPLRIMESAEARHIFTHREWHMQSYEVLVDETQAPPDGPVFLADRKGLDTTWSIPSAFAVYKEIVRGQLTE